MVEQRRGEPTTIERLRQASTDNLRRAESRKEKAREACEKANVGFRMFRHGSWVRIKQEIAASNWDLANAERVAEVMSGADTFNYKEEPVDDGYVEWKLEVGVGAEKIKMGARHFQGGPSVRSGYIAAFQADPYASFGSEAVIGDERFEVTERFKRFIDGLKDRGILQVTPSQSVLIKV